MSGERNSFDNFEELYTNCYWLVYRYVRHMVEKDLAAAEDVTQEVFLVAYQKWQEVRRHPNQTGRMERLSGADFFHAGAFDLEVLL